jgi:hypothetical protein
MKNLYTSVLLYFTLCSQALLHAQVPELNSYPSSNTVIYLDFDGQIVSGTMWNVNGPIIANPSGLSNTQITEIFNRVAEDYRPFNINITTSQAKYDAATYNRRMRVVITTSYEWYSPNAGGVAYINSWSWGDGTPCFVFSSLLNFNTKNVAEAASHEAGHTLGLRHQSTYDVNCVKTSDYNWGHGTGEIGWAPIMGAGYNQNLTLWHSGPNALGCSNIQSDLSIITKTANGITNRVDDNGDTYAAATSASFDANNQFFISGVIEKTDDKDMFKFILPTFSRFQLNAVPYNVGSGNAGSDVDLQVDIFDGAYQNIGTYNPGTLLSSIIDSFMNAGTYYMKVEGKGNIYAPEYGSLGSYSLQGTYADASVLPVRRLELKGQLEREQHILNWAIETNETITKQVIEVSADGRTFTSLDQPGTEDRSYIYRPAVNKPLLYRLHVTFNTNKEYFSNTITIRPDKTIKPQLTGNIVTGTSMNINSPADYDYRILDQNGRILDRGKITKGFVSIQTGFITPGIYIISFGNSREQWSEKFLKQ